MTGLGKGTKTKNTFLHRDEIKKHNPQILKFKNPLFPSSSTLFFIPSMPTLS